MSTASTLILSVKAAGGGAVDEAEPGLEAAGEGAVDEAEPGPEAVALGVFFVVPVLLRVYIFSPFYFF